MAVPLTPEFASGEVAAPPPTMNLEEYFAPFRANIIGID